MLREYLTNKYVLSAIGFLILLSVACVFWYRYDTAPDNQQLARDQEMLHQHEASKKIKTDTETKQSTDQTPTDKIMSSDEKPITKITDDVQNNSEAETEQSVISVSTGETRVSAFGFGPYPELPPDFPDQDIFAPPYYSENPNDPYKDDPEYELMDRVRVKLWKQGIQTTGVYTSGGLVYPTIPGTIYVKYERIEIADGVVSTRRSLSGDPEALHRIGHLWQKDGTHTLVPISFPPDITVIDADIGGINPWTLLDLQEE